MVITFSNSKLQKIVNDDKKLVKEFGKTEAKIIKQRLGQLLDAETLEDVRYLPGKYHELKQNRKGEWACSLEGLNRLVFTPHENPIPVNESGRYIWIEIKGVEIVEITDYH